MSDVILFGLPPSTYVRTAMMVLENKQVPYRFENVDFRSDDYLERHPFRRIPAFQHGDVRLFEVLAIGTYVDEVFDGPDLQPADPVARAEMMQWISAVNDYVYDIVVRKCVNERFVKPMRGLEPDEETIAAAKPVIAETLDVFDKSLSDRDFLAGPQFTLADMFLAPILVYFAVTPEGQEILPGRKHLSTWLERVRQTPGFERINSLG